MICARCAEDLPVKDFAVSRLTHTHREYCRRCTAQLHALAWQATNRDKKRAHRQVEQALQSGKLVRPNACEWCRTVGNVVAHHKDYAQPLVVEWICNVCHGNFHALEKDNPKLQAELHLHSDNPRVTCVNHPHQVLICKACEGGIAGRATARKHPGKHREWGRLGGRPRSEPRVPS